MSKSCREDKRLLRIEAFFTKQLLMKKRDLNSHDLHVYLSKSGGIILKASLPKLLLQPRRFS